MFENHWCDISRKNLLPISGISDSRDASASKNFFLFGTAARPGAEQWWLTFRYTCTEGKAFDTLHEQSIVGNCNHHPADSSSVSWKYNDATALPNCIRKLHKIVGDLIMHPFPAYCTTEFPNTPAHASVSFSQSTNNSGQVEIMRDNLSWVCQLI